MKELKIISKKTKGKIVILTTIPDDFDDASRKDNDEEVKLVYKSALELEYDPVVIYLTLNNIPIVFEKLEKLKPICVFNLLEDLDKTDRLVSIGPLLLEYFGIPYTGNTSEAFSMTSNKPLSKQIMDNNGIPTPKWIVGYSNEDVERFVSNTIYILKPIYEHSSITMKDDVLVKPTLFDQLIKMIKDKSEKESIRHFAEEYIEGREYNVTCMGTFGETNNIVLAEMTFQDYPQGKPHIVDWKAKWDTGSFEETHTVRTFEYSKEDTPLRQKLIDITNKCWRVFNLSGYARVDFRVDTDGNPFVLEVNTNPGIAPDSGFIAAGKFLGFTHEKICQLIIGEALQRFLTYNFKDQAVFPKT